MIIVKRVNVWGESTSSQVTIHLCSTDLYTCMGMQKRMKMNEYIDSALTTKYVTRCAEIINSTKKDRPMKEMA